MSIHEFHESKHEKKHGWLVNKSLLSSLSLSLSFYLSLSLLLSLSLSLLLSLSVHLSLSLSLSLFLPTSLSLYLLLFLSLSLSLSHFISLSLFLSLSLSLYLSISLSLFLSSIETLKRTFRCSLDRDTKPVYDNTVCSWITWTSNSNFKGYMIYSKGVKSYRILQNKCTTKIILNVSRNRHTHFQMQNKHE